MTPRRDNHFGNNGTEDDDQLHIYEDNGWRVGYDVEVNGIGFLEAVNGGSEDECSFSDSEVESDVDANEFTVHPGYRSLMQLENPSTENGLSSDGFNECLTETVILHDNGEVDANDMHITETDNYIKEIEERTSSTFETISNEVIAHQPIDIFLDDEKIEIIRAAMSGFTLPTPPQWPSLNNSQLSDIIKEKLA